MITSRTQKGVPSGLRSRLESCIRGFTPYYMVTDLQFSSDVVHSSDGNMPERIVVVFQTGRHSDGGVESITQIIEHLHTPTLIVTQLETARNERWRAAGAHVFIWPLGYRLGETFRYLPIRRKVSRLLSLLSTNWKMFWLARRRRAPIVHCNDITALLHSALGARLAGAAVVHNVRDLKPRSEAYGIKWRLAALLTTHIVVLSREMLTELKRRLPAVSQTRLNYIYSIVDPLKLGTHSTMDYGQLRRHLSIPLQQFAIAFVAAVCPKKAQRDFIKCCMPLLRKYPQLHVYFIGDCDVEKDVYAASCRDLSQSLGLNDSLTFVGHSSEVTAWYRACDVTIVPTKYEGLARCMIESLGCGTPVISFDVCSAQEILTDHNCGRVIRQGDYVGFASAIIELAENSSLRAELGANGVRVAKQLFDARRIAAEYDNLYNGLEARRR